MCSASLACLLTASTATVTLHAVLAFQKVHGLVVDGIVGPKTRDMLNALDARKAAA